MRPAAGVRREAIRLVMSATLALLLSGCGGAPPAVATLAAPVPTLAASRATPAAPVPTLAASGATPAAPVPALAASSATPATAVLTPEPTATPYSVRVGNTASQAIYLYHSPTTGDRIQSYPEGTELMVVGGDVEGDGLTWHNVRAPDGTEGYIPVGDTVPEAD